MGYSPLLAVQLLNSLIDSAGDSREVLQMKFRNWDKNLYHNFELHEGFSPFFSAQGRVIAGDRAGLFFCVHRRRFLPGGRGYRWTVQFGGFSVRDSRSRASLIKPNMGVF